MLHYSVMITLTFLSAVTPADWSSYSGANMKKAECEKQDSVTLLSLITGVIEHTCFVQRERVEQDKNTPGMIW